MAYTQHSNNKTKKKHKSEEKTTKTIRQKLKKASLYKRCINKQIYS